MKAHRITSSLIAELLFAGLLHSGAVGAAEPIKLTVGYQPYDTISYSAAVIRAQELWKRYLPPGSELEFQVGL